MCTALLPCPLCCQPHFSTLESLRIGLIKVATESLACPVCNETFMGLDKLTIHLFSHCVVGEDRTEPTKTIESSKKPKYQKIHINNEIIKDQETKPPVFNISTLPFIGIPGDLNDDSIRSHSNQTGKTLSERCDICGFYFLGKNILQMHKKLIHNVQEDVKISKNVCQFCSKTFKMKGSLMVHLRMVHPENGCSVDSKADILQKDIVSNDSTSSNFISKPADAKIMVTIDEVNNNNNISNNSPNTSNKQWECDICRKMFTTKYFLKKHKRLHTGEMPYSCAQCHKTFTFQQSYHKHLLYHNDDKPHTCTHCGRSFKELSTLHNHQRIHTGEKPFSCESCGKCFRQRVSYLVHRRIHTGVMPYKCTACEKNFRYKVSQRTHKCTAQPPGTVIRQSGELVQKLIKNQCEPDVKNTKDLLECQVNINSKLNFPLKIKQDEASACLTNIEPSTKRKIEDEEKNIIDEIIKDSLNKIDFGEPENSIANVCTKSEIYNVNSVDVDLPSPSEKFKNLKLSSNHGSPTMISTNVVDDSNFNFLNNDFQKDANYAISGATYQDSLIFRQIFP